MTVADMVVDELLARGVGFIATLNGHGLDPLYLACKRRNMRMIDVRNEQAASYMAEVTGRLSRGVGVCAVSGAVAHANALTGVVNAMLDGSPMLLITGTTGHGSFGWGDFQDFDPVPMAAPVCKYARRIDVPGRAAQIVHEAFAAATSGRPGPVHLTLPMDVAAMEVEASTAPRSRVRLGIVATGGAAASDQIDRAVHMLEQARQPVLVAGSGVYYARGEAALSRLARQQQMPTVVPIWDRGSIEGAEPTFLGVVGAGTGGPRLIEDADLLILAGARFDYRVGQLSAPTISSATRLIRIDDDPRCLREGLEADLSIAGSPALVLDQLAAACAAHGCCPTGSWLEETRRRRAGHQDGCRQVAARLEKGINGMQVVEAVKAAMTNRTILLVDGGNIGQWFHQFVDYYPGHLLTCGASGVVGWGLPGAMAARALHPDRPVILLTGDGAFTFTVAELECAARQGLGFAVVVADDQQWGISVTGHVRDFGEPLYSMLGPMRLDSVAEGFGCRGVRIDEADRITPAILEAQVGDRPTVIQVPIVPGSPALTR